MKGQASIELFMTLGVVIAFTIPVIFLIFSVNQMGYEDSTIAQADSAARSLAEAINSVYSQGPGASRTMLINTPPSTQSVVVSANGEVAITIKTSKGTYTGVAPTFATVNPVTITDGKGLFAITMSMPITGPGVLSIKKAVSS